MLAILSGEQRTLWPVLDQMYLTYRDADVVTALLHPNQASFFDSSSFINPNRAGPFDGARLIVDTLSDPLYLLASVFAQEAYADLIAHEVDNAGTHEFPDIRSTSFSKQTR